MAKQAIKKGAITKNVFSVKDFKNNSSKLTKVAEKPLEWFIMPKGFQEALSLPGIPKGWFSGCYGWNSTGKSTIKNCLIASAQKQGVYLKLRVILILNMPLIVVCKPLLFMKM